MRHLFVLVHGLLLLWASGCSHKCPPGRIAYGERCVLVPDEGMQDAGADGVRDTDAAQPVCADDSCDPCAEFDCGAKGVCTISDGGAPVCQCATGFAVADTGRCEDVNECAQTASNDCAPHAACTNEAGTYRCECQPGFVGDGKECRGDAVSIAAGDATTCAILSDRSLWCWGAALGRSVDAVRSGSSASFATRPQRIGMDNDWTNVAVADQLMCGVRGEGRLNCWGPRLLDDQGNARDVTSALVIEPNLAFREVVVSGTSFCASMRTDGAVCAKATDGVVTGTTSTEFATSVHRRGVSLLGDTEAGATKLRSSNDPQSALVSCDAWDGYCGRSELGDPVCATPLDSSLTFAANVSNLASPPSSIAGGPHFGCAIAAGQLSCWRSHPGGVPFVGGDPAGWIAEPVGTISRWVDVKMGWGHACVRGDGGEVSCVGANHLGQSGRPVTSVTSPMRVGDHADWKHVVVGGGWTCAQRADQSWHCWGRVPRPSDYDDLTAGLVDLAALPSSEHGDAVLAAATEPKLVTLSATLGGGFANAMCGTWSDGRARCFKPPADADGGWAVAVRTDVDDNSDWISVSLGSNVIMHRLCGIRGADLYCGDNGAAPAKASDLTGWTSVRTAGSHQCALRAGELYCWGNNSAGELGTGNTGNAQDKPVRIGVDSDWSAVAVSGRPALESGFVGSSCGIRAGQLFCWGENAFGQLGVGTLDDEPSPVAVDSADDWTTIQLASGDGTFACGLRGTGLLFCWGDNQAGNLGVGDFATRHEPTRAGDATDWAEVAVQGAPSPGNTGGHACAIRKGNLYCWGDNTFGQLGIRPPRALAPVEWK